MPVGVVDQHHARLHFQAGLLPVDHVLILRDEPFAEKFQKRRHRKPAEEIPRGHKIQTATGSRRMGVTVVRLVNQYLPQRILFCSHVGQDEIDLRRDFLAVNAQQLVGLSRCWTKVRASSCGSPSGWARPLFLFFANAAAAAPVPGLVHEWPVRRVHQACNACVHIAGEVSGEMRDSEAIAEFRQLWGGRNSAALNGAAFGICEVHPNVAIALLAREAARKDALALQLGIRCDRGNFAALSRVRVKSPAVIGAFDRLPVALSCGKRKRAVRANVAQRKGFSNSVSPKHERDFHAHRSDERSPAKFVAAQGGIPEAPCSSSPSIV